MTTWVTQLMRNSLSVLTLSLSTPAPVACVMAIVAACISAELFVCLSPWIGCEMFIEWLGPHQTPTPARAPVLPLLGQAPSVNTSV